MIENWLGITSKIKNCSSSQREYNKNLTFLSLLGTLVHLKTSIDNQGILIGG